MAIPKLVIVESPAKAKTINRFLGKDYKVVASMGHIRDLPETLLGIDIKNNFRPMYEESRRKQKILTDLRLLAKDAKEIYLAPDPDREGEAIAWHLFEILKGCTKEGKFFRVSFHEITSNAIQKAFQSAGKINMNLVDAQQARRVLDRLVGYQVSPLLWSSIERGRGISAGRVQSVALRLVVERERDIENFKSEEFWNLWVNLSADNADSGKMFRAKFTRNGADKVEVRNKADADKILASVKDRKHTIITAENSSRTKHPAPPFITSTLQQIAGSVLRFSAKQTMQVAQELYEGIDIGGQGAVGLITYMRTDSVNIAREAQESARTYIQDAFGKEFVPAKLPTYRNKTTAQEAHEAIRPTDIKLTPDMLRQYLSPTQQKLYTLIWKRFVASQMASATQRRTTVETQAEGTPYIFKAVSTETLFPGYLKVFGEEEKQASHDGLAAGDEEQLTHTQFLHELKKDEQCVYCGTDAEQKFTEPPPRFSEATLVKELETNGIGRPSTYATIVNTIQERKYVARNKGKLSPTELGMRVNDYLVEHLPELFQVNFTANMENRLDEIEEGKIKWVDMLKEFYFNSFTDWLENAKLQNAPDSNQTRELIDLLKEIKTWHKNAATAQKRAYDDQRFIGSIERQFEKNKRITEKQWNTLIRLAANYEDQLPNLQALAQKFNFTELLDSARFARDGKSKTGEEIEISPKMKALFDALDKVKFAPPAEDAPRAFNEKNFIDSIREQLLKGKSLSPKQESTVARLVDRYSNDNPDLNALGLEAGLPVRTKVAHVVEPMQPNQLAKINVIMEFLDANTTWDPPVKRGQKSYDDAGFYESMRTQFRDNGTLSPRQYNALLRMYERYNDTTGKKKQTRQKIFANTKDTGDQTLELLSSLENITEWEPGKGRFDDKRFYESLKKQHESGKILSEKQRDILFKIVKKYTTK